MSVHLSNDLTAGRRPVADARFAGSPSRGTGGDLDPDVSIEDMSLDELRDLLARHARPDLSTPIEDLRIFRAERPQPPVPTTYGKVLALVAQGTKRFALGKHLYEYRAGQYLIASVDLPVTAYFEKASPQEPGLGFGLTLHPSAIAEVLLQAGADEPAALDPDTAPGLAVSTAPAELVEAAVRLLRLLDRPRDIPVLAPLIKREIIWRLITGEQGATVRQFGFPDSSLSHIARAVQRIRDDYAQPFRVEELAQQAGMSTSAFHRNFQTVTAMSPIQFQKQIRLQQARLLLAADPADIAGISRRVGYQSPAQFSRDYRRQFGNPPTRDAHLRAYTRTGAPSASRKI
ncbi:AraC family transcriptional regulator [Paractinoplanes toevensis]|uniref:AraC family transcriptional regulator n=1 Tax=Paractinoplanes toevensis TaxID=571911 RepID=A0A919T8I9_9ACTN|nr:AraC family transcriptional regulator [Actinoplanes toevensis]GIM90046.1 AraC family transcriptional regulator [Actinoplanes toevensis]